MDAETLKYKNGLQIAKWYGYKNLERLSYSTLFQFLELRGFVCFNGWLWSLKSDLEEINRKKQLVEEDREWKEC
jgi:hypothetical protein